MFLEMKTVGPYRMPPEGLPARMEVMVVFKEGRPVREKKAWPFSTSAGEVIASQAAATFVRDAS